MFDDEAIPERSPDYILPVEEDGTSEIVPLTEQDLLAWNLMVKIRPLLKLLLKKG